MSLSRKRRVSVAFLFLAALCAFSGGTLAADKKPPQKPAAAEVNPGEEAIEFVDKRKGSIKKNGSIWWRGANRKEALLADGTYPLKDGTSITAKGGKLVKREKTPAAAKAKKPAGTKETPHSPPSPFISAPADAPSVIKR